MAIRCCHHQNFRFHAAGNIKADKEKSTERSDGVIATIMRLAESSAVEMLPGFCV